MVCTVWALASVTDQGVKATEGREHTNGKTSFSTDGQTKSESLVVCADNSMTGDHNSRAESSVNTI